MVFQHEYMRARVCVCASIYNAHHLLQWLYASEILEHSSISLITETNRKKGLIKPHY